VGASRLRVNADTINDHNHILKIVKPIAREAHTEVAVLEP
jgi:hypothetical protein